MADAFRVLVVDGPNETGQVLKAVLEPRGLQVDRVRTLPAVAPGMADLVVIDDDGSPPPDAGPGLGDIPHVVIGTYTEHRDDSDGVCFLQKPFEYPQLVDMIERLLKRRPAA